MPQPLKDKLECALNTKRNKRRTREESREIIIVAAAALFAENGYKNTTTKQIAEHARVLNSTLYNSFSSKDEILKEIIRRGYVQALEKVKTFLEGEDFIVALAIPIGLCIHTARSGVKQAELMTAAFQSWSIMSTFIDETVEWIEYYYDKYGISFKPEDVRDNLIAVVGSLSYFLMRIYNEPESGDEKNEMRICIESFCTLFRIPFNGTEATIEKIFTVLDDEILNFDIHSVCSTEHPTE